MYHCYENKQFKVSYGIRCFIMNKLYGMINVNSSSVQPLVQTSSKNWNTLKCVFNASMNFYLFRKHCLSLLIYSSTFYLNLSGIKLSLNTLRLLTCSVYQTSLLSLSLERAGAPGQNQEDSILQEGVLALNRIARDGRRNHNTPEAAHFHTSEVQVTIVIVETRTRGPKVGTSEELVCGLSISLL